MEDSAVQLTSATVLRWTADGYYCSDCCGGAAASCSDVDVPRTAPAHRTPGLGQESVSDSMDRQKVPGLRWFLLQLAP
jgi:hypothetical protein